MVIVGIDPGSRKTGYGIVSVQGNHFTCLDYGVIATGNGALPEKLRLIHSGLSALFARHSPATVVVEEIFHAANARSALVLGEARGVVLLAAAEAGIPLAEYTALQIKKAVVGYGKADKTQVQMMVRRLLNLKEDPQPLDASDALAVALCHGFNKSRYLRTQPRARSHP